jgi:hypothetical protein
MQPVGDSCRTWHAADAGRMSHHPPRFVQRELAEQEEDLPSPGRDPVRIAAARIEEYVGRGLARCAGKPDQFVLDLERTEMLVAAQIDCGHGLPAVQRQR